MISVQASAMQPQPPSPLCPQCPQHLANRPPCPPGLTCPQHDKSTKSTMSTLSTWFIFEPFLELWALLMLGSAFLFLFWIVNVLDFTAAQPIAVIGAQYVCGAAHCNCVVARCTMLYAAWPIAVCTMLCGPLHLHVIGFDQIRRGPQAGQAPAKWPQLCCLV